MLKQNMGNTRILGNHLGYVIVIFLGNSGHFRPLKEPFNVKVYDADFGYIIRLLDAIYNMQD